MYVLDTNVVSETLAASPSRTVAAWLDSHDRELYYVSSITRAELLVGLLILPEGSRKRALADLIAGFFRSSLVNPVLPFEADDADRMAEIYVRRRRLGRPMTQADAQIAAISGNRGFTLVTRNVRDFLDCGIEVIDPWK